MAEEEKENKDEDHDSEESDLDEAAELQRMLDEDEEGEAQQSTLAGKIKGFLTNKKIAIPLAVVLLLLLAGGVFMFIFSDSPPVEESADQKIEDEVSEGEEKEKGKEKDEEVIKEFKKINVYRLERFLLPLENKEGEGGRFVSISLSFLLSNQKLGKELDNNVGEIRRNVYNLLKTKKPNEYIQNRLKVRDRLKNEIVTVSNSILSSGVGTIKEVLFTEFVVK